MWVFVTDLAARYVIRPSRGQDGPQEVLGADYNGRMIHDGKQLGGFEQVQGWCARTVERQAPMTLVVQTLVKVWYLKYGIHATSAQPRGTDWTSDKDHPSYLDMLATLRRVLWEYRINHDSTPGGRPRRIWKMLQFTLCAAV
jgi:hypothetical protein